MNEYGNLTAHDITVSSHGDTLPDSAPWQVYLLPLLLLIQAAFLGSTFNTVSTTLALAVVCGLCVFIHHQWSAKSRDHRGSVNDDAADRADSKEDAESFRSGGVPNVRRFARRLPRAFLLPAAALAAFIGIAWRVGHHMSGNLNPVAMVVDSVAHAAFLVSLLLWCLYPRKGHPAMLFSGVILVLATVTAGGVSHSIQGQLVAALALVIAFTFGSRYILSRWQIESSKRMLQRRRDRMQAELPLARPGMTNRPLPKSTATYSDDSGRSGLLFSILALSILLTATSAAGHLASRVVPGLQLDFFDRLTQTLESVSSHGIIGGSRYVRGSTLGSVRRHMIGDPAEIAVRAYAETEPGYLRGTVFDVYRRGRWGARKPSFYPRLVDTSSIEPREPPDLVPGTVKLQGVSKRPLEHFEVHSENSAPLVGTIEVHNVPTKGQIVFSALTTDWIEASTYGVTITHHDIVDGGVDFASPYVLGIGASPPREQLSRLRKEILLELPDEIREEVQPLTEQVCDGRLTARAKAAAIETYFQSNFSYSLQSHVVPRNVDPLLHFLRIQHPAHCEYFASAAAVMLRSVGIPTRYVTGYVLREVSDDDEYWIARNRDAHAWVEAYDEISEQWFPVEATVGRVYRTLNDENDNRLNDSAATTGLDETDEDTGFISRMLGWMLAIRPTESLTVLFRVAQLPLLCAVIVLLWIRHRQKLRAGGDPLEFRSRQMLQTVDRKLRRHALIRSPNETLHQFARRVEDGASVGSDDASAFLRSAAAWYRSFAAARYRGLMPEPLEGV
ncbi:transglutaminase domain-containing protein [Roseiconus nitratireducens]|uniref:Transglutaminase domain-containing protein n=1 Tax=Roseiconus nitratireducens TaxID=2605748 RepID=A0A5M6DCH8_9BACT|nr:transglutaminase-like domain-containing protein [Roseiconus nitratireducens]KAA5545214.1 transglutaminase domain-containing protein [Roseiconus nitratireducens]